MSKPTKKQATQLRKAGLDPARIQIRSNPDAAKESEIPAIRAARDDARTNVHNLRERKKELIAEFLRNDPDARLVQEELTAEKNRLDVAQMQLNWRRVEIVECGHVFNTVRAKGDTFAAAMRNLEEQHPQ